MAVSPFTFFRGAALPMASDLSSTPCTGIVVQACGDAHLANFGVFASPERRFVSDINDFDETLPGPGSGTSNEYAHADQTAVERRFAAKLSKARRKKLERTFGKARTKDNLGVLDRFAGIVDGQPRIVADPPLIVPVGDLVAEGTEPTEVEHGLREVLSAYRTSLEHERRALFDQYRPVDFARKVVGVGSGCRRRTCVPC